MTDFSGQSLGQYQISEPIGEGGMATVYKAYDPGLDRYVAIKFIRPEYATEQNFTIRLEREARTIARLRHNHIVQVYEFGEYEKRPYLVMEYIEGQSLRKYLHSVQNQGKRLEPSEILALMEQITQALDYAHENDIIHRDIKPDNILLNKNGQAYLTDFGIAKLLNDASNLTHTGIAIGTPTYMSPEQINGELDQISPASDLYALGVILYEIMVGRPPYIAETAMAVMFKHLNDPTPAPHKFNPLISPAMEAVMLKAIMKTPQDRYQSGRALLEALQEAFNNPSPQQKPIFRKTNPELNYEGPTELTPTHERLQQMAQGRRQSSALIGAGMVVLLLIGAGLTMLLLKGDDTQQEGAELSPFPSIQGDDLESTPLDPLNQVLIEFTQTAQAVALSETITATHWTQTPSPSPSPTPNATATYEQLRFEVGLTLTAAVWTATPSPLGFAGNPVSRNEDWRAIIETINRAEMVFVPTGCFMMGSEDVGGARPEHEQCFDTPFWIGRYEVTNGEYRRFMNAGGYSSPRFWTEAGWAWRIENNVNQPRFWDDKDFNAAQQPVVGVSWYEANAYARWLGMRLPTEAEWEYAARGPNAWVYPWGDEFIADNLAYVGNSANLSKPVGSHPNGASWVGAQDMAGNVWEWTSSLLMSYPYDSEDGREDMTNTSRRALRSSTWNLTQYDSVAAFRTNDLPRDRFNVTGFRLVCEVYHPDTGLCE